MTTIARRIIDSALPEGPIWEVQPGGQLDAVLDALATNFEDTRTKAAAVESVRDPEKTTSLSDLEIDFGVLPDTSISAAARRTYLAAIKGERGTTCSWEFLENKLRAMGYDVRVYPNDPPLDPEDVIPIAGYNSEWIVNGDVIWSQQKDYDTTCEDESLLTGFHMTCECDTMTTGFDVTCDSYHAMERDRYEYPYPITPARWPFIFWIAKSMTGNERFEDWAMEWYTTTAWTAGANTTLAKSTTYKTGGIRSLRVTASADSVEPYAEQTLATAAVGTRTVTVKVWTTTNRRAVLEVCDKDGVWDTVGRVESPDSPVAYTLSYSALNGVSAVRLYLVDGFGAFTVVTGDSAWFDDLRCEGLTIEVAEIPDEQRLNFRKAVLRYKPMRTWCGMLVDWTGDFDLEEDDMSYRSVTTTASGNLAITNSEADVHIILKGTATGYTVTFDDATTFDEDRLFRFTNHTTQSIIVKDGAGNTLATMLSLTSVQFDLTDRSTAAGNWLALGYMTGAGA
jgi:uncharacterized protein YmfQ (DUF2313 family)